MTKELKDKIFALLNNNIERAFVNDFTEVFHYRKRWVMSINKSSNDDLKCFVYYSEWFRDFFEKYFSLQPLEFVRIISSWVKKTFGIKVFAFWGFDGEDFNLNVR